jgi:flavin-dependent dehydrogenase
VTDRFDVVVVGAGPAGCAAAIACADEGLDVAVVERAAFPRHRPGESLPPGVETILAQLGAVDVLHRADVLRYPGVWIRWGDKPRFQPFGGDAAGPWLGFQVDRADLDTALLARARSLGVEVHQPCRALRLLSREGRVAGVATSHGPLDARWVIDAAGSGHWLARRLGLARERASPRLLSRYGYARGPFRSHPASPLIAADGAGWTWTAEVGPGRSNWTRLALSAAVLPDGRPPDEHAALAAVGPVRGADVTWRRVAEGAGAGYFCVGDALAVLDPASGHGVLRALMAGVMSARLLGRMRAGVCTEAEAAAVYRRWAESWFRADARALRHFYRALPDPPVWILVEFPRASG